MFNNSKKIFVLAATVFLLLNLSGVIFAEEQAPSLVSEFAEKARVAEKDLPFTSAVGYQIVIPVSYEYVVFDNTKVLLIFKKEDAVFTLSMTTKKNLDTSLPLSDIVDAVCKNMEDLKNYYFDTKRAEPVNGREAYKVDYTVTTSGKPMKGTLVFIRMGERIYNLNFAATEKAYNDYTADYSKVLNSLQFEK